MALLDVVTIEFIAGHDYIMISQRLPHYLPLGFLI